MPKALLGGLTKQLETLATNPSIATLAVARVLAEQSPRGTIDDRVILTWGAWWSRGSLCAWFGAAALSSLPYPCFIDVVSTGRVRVEVCLRWVLGIRSVSVSSESAWIRPTLVVFEVFIGLF